MAKKENKPASAYAKPHSMSGGPAKLRPEQDFMSTLRPSAGSAGMRLDKGVKTDGIKIRGTGAATKGVLARGPMA